ncbi:MAG: clostripain-related cysteine peptidase [Acutalibacteraceae bacterium]
MIKCPNCKAEIDKKSVFCPFCGAHVAESLSKKKYLKIISVVLAVALVVGCSVPLLKKSEKTMATKAPISFDSYVKSSNAENKKVKTDAITPKKEQTIMMYMVGSDLESQGGFATMEFVELQKGGIDSSKCNFVIFTGGTYSWQAEGMPQNQNALLYLNNNELEILGTCKLMNMGNASTLSYFLDYAYQAFPAEQYSLILWDHGGGPLYGFGCDEVFSDRLYLPEISDALKDSPFSSSEKLEWIGFDACLMADLEVAYTLKDYAKYMIASQEVASAAGWNYEAFFELSKKKYSGEEAGKIISEEALNDLERHNVAQVMIDTYTSSCLDLSKVDNVIADFENLINASRKDMFNKFVNFCQNRKELVEYGSITASGDYELVDFAEVAISFENEYPEETQKLLSSLEDFIVCNITDTKYSNGVSIYYPFDYLTRIDDCLNNYSEIGLSDTYSNYLQDFINLLTGDIWSFWENNSQQEEAEPTTGNETTTQRYSATTAESQTLTERITSIVTTTVNVITSTTSPAPSFTVSATHRNEQPQEHQTPYSALYSYVESGENGRLKARFSERQKESFIYARKCIYGSTYGIPYLRTMMNDVKYENGFLSADFRNSVFSISSDGKKVECLMIEKQRTDDAIYCWVPCLLSRTGATSFFDMMSEGISVMLIVVFTDDYPDGKISGACFSDSNDVIPVIELKKGYSIYPYSFWCEEKDDYDEYGNNIPVNKRKNCTICYDPIGSIVVDDSLCIVRYDFLPEENYYINFQIFNVCDYTYVTDFISM